ncbi:hypothetical protein AV530_002739 [Patagioenas fasciata monilis]|uniref:Uncharacterized protein n=1 Tax=Patagioenas fasciata monilis TaxID=372326 RepID=A0A1V4J789_PATFA|nr:hypothetical protein AV530_002739 [Patagioenas fasciata monilis]
MWLLVPVGGGILHVGAAAHCDCGYGGYMFVTSWKCCASPVQPGADELRAVRTKLDASTPSKTSFPGVSSQQGIPPPLLWISANTVVSWMEREERETLANKQLLLWTEAGTEKPIFRSACTGEGRSTLAKPWTEQDRWS